MEGQFKVLCIGVNKVPGTGFNELTYAEKNAAAAATFFKTSKSADVTLLNHKDASKTNISNWIKQCRSAPGKTTVVLFFSGFASAEKNKSNTGWERCLWIDGNEDTSLDSHQLKTSEILHLLENSLHRLILVIDACYHLERKPPVKAIFEEFKKSERITSLKPYVVISSSAVGRYLFEDPALKLGVFTHYFLKILSGRYTFFLKKKIAFFRMLQLLDKKVRNHRFTTDTGRKIYIPMLIKNGISVHFIGKSFNLPILEPTSLIGGPSSRFFKKKSVRLVHFFTRTRLRVRVCLIGGVLGILLLFLYFVSISMIRIHFSPPRQAVFHYNLLESQQFPLDKLEAQRVGKNHYQEVNFYLFKHNWANAFLDKLDETGKIILLGNLLGRRLDGIIERKKMGYALENTHDIFYWDPEDVMTLLKTIRSAYRNFSNPQKQNVLQLLAKLGKNGEHTAQWTFTFKKETDQNLRNLFLQHFYTPDFVEKRPDFLNIHDYLYLKKNKKQLPPEVEHRLRSEIEIYLQPAADGIPDSPLDITDKTKLSEIYKKLETLALFGSPHFREKASIIFKQAFFPDEVFGLFWDADNLQDKLWLLELYMKRVQHVDNPFLVWDQLVYRYIPHLTSRAEKNGVLKIIMDTNLELIPQKYWNNLILALRHLDPQTVTLTDWDNWLRRYPLKPLYIQYMFHWIIEKRYEKVFPFLRNRYESFKNFFNGGVLDSLYEFNKIETVNLAKEIFEIGEKKDRLHAAVFLYNKGYPEYSSFIIRFLERAIDNLLHRRLIGEFYGDINKAIIQLIGTNKHLKGKFKVLLHHPELFYRFFKINKQFWPKETIQRLLTSQIPRKYTDGYLFLKRCEQLPDAYRKKMLIKMFKTDIDPHFRSRVELSLANHYPRQFLELAFDKQYQWNRYTRDNVVKAYQTFPNETLFNHLILNLKKEFYWKVGFICEALVTKKDQELNIQDIQHILEEFERPLERIVLRELRYYLHKRQFLEVR